MHAYVPNHLVWAILATLFCCLPGGIVALVHASRIDTLVAAGNVAGAREASDKARFWCLVSLFTPLIGLVAYLLLLAMGLGLGALANSF
ncbi:CD225/dispanin family protein [Arenimonas aestuarii]